MALTRNFQKTIAARIEHDPAFAHALLSEALALFLSGESDAAQLILRTFLGADDKA